VTVVEPTCTQASHPSPARPVPRRPLPPSSLTSVSSAKVIQSITTRVCNAPQTAQTVQLQEQVSVTPATQDSS